MSVTAVNSPMSLGRWGEGEGVAQLRLWEGAAVGGAVGESGVGGAVVEEAATFWLERAKQKQKVLEPASRGSNAIIQRHQQVFAGKH